MYETLKGDDKSRTLPNDCQYVLELSAGSLKNNFFAQEQPRSRGRNSSEYKEEAVPQLLTTKHPKARCQC